jgi:membrane-bound serine protease (ClpP class)
MSPGSSIGAASPVSMGGEGMSKTMKKKVTNDAAAYLRSLAEAHGRSGDWGDKFVRKGSSLSETEALKENVIDLVAADLGELLTAIDGRKVKTQAGEIVLATKSASTTRAPMTWRENFFNMLANPNIAYLLMMLGFYGLIFELSNPGAVLPGVVGAICLVLAFYSLQTLPINYAGALLIMMAFIMFLLEIWVQSYGMLTLGGIAALVVGSMMLVDSPEEYLKISLMVIIPATVITSGFFIFLVGAGIRAQYRSSTIGIEALAGSYGVCDQDISLDASGKILLDGDLWDADAQEEIAKGASVEVVSARGLTLTVKRRT